jgi:hypothetical protein
MTRSTRFSEELAEGGYRDVNMKLKIGFRFASALHNARNAPESV